ncbi:thiamine pyrophosphate-dependent enzyme [Streptomyces sp. NBC_00285]|uniref:thiamine pyrophosphate-dependent enzyme n=1 Tax=Streptomyces sp. NBC_00285 TaxID=2975700 RepID=UPI002E2CC1B3|nr:thiamine pyrophosphate-dependent enzyme [Streptomyces sp. NBC_00285]
MTQAPQFTAASIGTRSAHADQLLEMYRRMRRIRRFEERASELYKATEIPGFLHLSIGQEATAVGACRPLGERDGITSTHRGHGHVLAKGLDSASMMAELMGKEAGTNHGRGGSMHIADPRLGIYGANGSVGAGLPIATGVATAAKLRAAGDAAGQTGLSKHALGRARQHVGVAGQAGPSRHVPGPALESVPVPEPSCP